MYPNLHVIWLGRQNHYLQNSPVPVNETKELALSLKLPHDDYRI